DRTIRHADPPRQFCRDDVVFFSTKPLKTCFVARSSFVPCASKQGGKEAAGDGYLSPFWNTARCCRYQSSQNCQTPFGIMRKIFGPRFLYAHILKRIFDGKARRP